MGQKNSSQVHIYVWAKRAVDLGGKFLESIIEFGRYILKSASLLLSVCLFVFPPLQALEALRVVIG
jgi:hypothetical protein